MFKCPKYVSSTRSCPITTDNSEKCSEKDTFNIIYEFKRIYEEKINSIDPGSGDGLEMKINLQQRWIEDLTEQVQMMAKIVKDLENEAIERVQLLEDKLQQSAKCICEVMKRYNSHDFTLNSEKQFQDKSFYLLNDVKNVLEFIRRIREDDKWSMDGLKFYEISRKDLLGDESKTCRKETCSSLNKPTLCEKSKCLAIQKHSSCDSTTCPNTSVKIKSCDSNNCPNVIKQESCDPSSCPRRNIEKCPQICESFEYEQSKEIIKHKEKTIQKLQEENKRLRSFGDPEELLRDIQRYREKYEQLKQSMEDMRNALTEEVAYKHDVILMLKRDMQQLEERCIQSNKQMAYKDDIIKELRKEVKQLREDQKLKSNTRSLTDKITLMKVPRDIAFDSTKRDNNRPPQFCDSIIRQSGRPSRKQGPNRNTNERYSRSLSPVRRTGFAHNLEDASFEEFARGVRGRSNSLSPTRRSGVPSRQNTDKDVGSFEDFSRGARELPNSFNSTRRNDNPTKQNTGNLDVDSYEEFSGEARERSNISNPTRRSSIPANQRIDNLDVSSFEESSKGARERSKSWGPTRRSSLTRFSSDLALPLYEESDKQPSNDSSRFNDDITDMSLPLFETVIEKPIRRSTQPERNQNNDNTQDTSFRRFARGAQEGFDPNVSHEEKSNMDLYVNPIIWGNDFSLENEEENVDLNKRLDTDRTVMWSTIQGTNKMAKSVMWESHLPRKRSINTDNDILNRAITPKMDPDNILHGDHSLRRECNNENSIQYVRNSKVIEKEITINLQIDKDILNKRINSKTHPDKCDNNKEVEKLRNKCKELEHALACSDCRAENLQQAVDLYLNSINLLETTEERARFEIEQQKITIFNLQEALLASKTELEEFKEKNQQDIQDQNYVINILNTNLMEMEKEQDYKQMKFSEIGQFCKNLQDINFKLEVENFNSKQDLSIYETRLCKYQNEYKKLEVCKCGQDKDLQKLREQKKFQDEIIKYFKEEMSEMSDQLVNLQKVLKYSNKSCKEENEKLITSVVELQKLNDRLLVRLNQSEQKLAHKMQINETRIGELQQIIDHKNCELNLHDVAIEEIKTHLNQALADNKQLQSTINCLNNTLIQQENQLKSYEKKNLEHLERKSQMIQCQKSVEDCRANLQIKNKEVSKLRNENNKRFQSLQKTQKEIRLQKEINQKLNSYVKDLEQKLEMSESDNQQLNNDMQKLCKKCGEISDKEGQIKMLKQIIVETKQALINLNEQELNNQFLSDDFKKTLKTNKDCCNDLNCDFELNVLKKILNNLQNTLICQSRVVLEIEETNTKLDQDLKQHQMKLKESQKCQITREIELSEKLHSTLLEEQRLNENCKCLQNDLKKLRQENQHLKASQKDLNKTQDEINGLKIEIKKMIENQICLNNENDKLHQQLLHLKELEERVGKMEIELETTKDINKDLIQQNDDLTNDLQCLHCCYAKLDKKHRYMNDSVRYLEQELSDLRANRDDICLESQHVVDNVRIWLEEQRRINVEVNRKNRNYCDIIEQLKLERQNLLNQIKPELTAKINKSPEAYRLRSPSPPSKRNYTNQWNLGSQGTESTTDSPTNESPVSFASCSLDGWCCPASKDNLSDDEYIRRIEGLTAEVKKNNRVWIVEKHHSFS